MSNLKLDTMQIARDEFLKLKEKFSNLEITENKNDLVEISLTIAEQTGLKQSAEQR